MGFPSVEFLGFYLRRWHEFAIHREFSATLQRRGKGQQVEHFVQKCSRGFGAIVRMQISSDIPHELSLPWISFINFAVNYSTVHGTTVSSPSSWLLPTSNYTVMNWFLPLMSLSSGTTYVNESPFSPPKMSHNYISSLLKLGSPGTVIFARYLCHNEIAMPAAVHKSPTIPGISRWWWGCESMGVGQRTLTCLVCN
jgi:hypothetical protein